MEEEVKVPDVSKMSVKELRKVIVESGLSHTDCLEKSDLIARAQEALSKARQQPPSSATEAASAGAPGGLTRETRVIAGHDCLVVFPSSGASEQQQQQQQRVDLVVVLLHGYGAGKEDFAMLPEMLPVGAGKNIAWVFPDARLRDAGGMRQWWEINVMEWMASMQGGEGAIGQLIRKEFGGMAECRLGLSQLATAVCEQFGNPPLCFAGFSQGAMTALDAALHLGDDTGVNCVGVAMLSGAPIVIEQWQPRLAARAPGSLKMLVTHGRNDQVLPFPASEWLHQLLSSTLGGEHVTYLPHNGGHDLGGKEGDLARFVTGLCSSSG